MNGSSVSFQTMIKEASIVVDTCIKIQKGEKVLIGTDSARSHEANAIASLCNARGAEVLIVDLSSYVLPIKAGRYVDPPDRFKDMMKSSNVTILVTSQEYSQRFSHKIHYFLNQTAECCVYQVDEDVGLWDYSMEDVQKVMENGNKILNFMKQAKWVHVTSKRGTDVKFCIEGRECLAALPILPRPPMQAADPIPLWGELNWAPIENLSAGRVVVDGILMRWGSESAISEPVEWQVRDGRIVDIKGGPEATEFKRTLESADPNAYIIGELGIGASHKGKLGTMQEKGILGTVHLGVGSNKGVYPGGTNVSKIHGDGSIRDISIEVDGKQMISDGKLII